MAYVKLTCIGEKDGREKSVNMGKMMREEGKPKERGRTEGQMETENHKLE